MIRRYRMVAVHLLAVLLSCAVIRPLGYKWLELEREIERRRGKDAAEAEAAGTRQALSGYLDRVAAEVARPDYLGAACAAGFHAPGTPAGSVTQPTSRNSLRCCLLLHPAGRYGV